MTPARPLALITLLGLCSLAGNAQAGAGLASEASAQILSGNVWTRPDDGSEWTRYAFNQTAPVTLEAVRQLELVDAQGNPGTTVFSHSATASAGYGRLSVAASVAVSNPLPRGDGPLYTVYEGGRDVVQPGGLPDGYGARAYAAMTDTVSVGGSRATQVQFLLHLDGTLDGLTETQRSYFMPSAGVQLDQRDGNLGGRWGNVFYQGSQPGYNSADNSWAMAASTVGVDVWSKPFTVSAGQVVFTFELYARAEVSDLSQSGMGGGSFSASADFSHTLRVTGARGLDAGGAEVALGSLVGQSGTVYAVSSVPEPSAWLLMLLGAPLLAGRARARARSAAQG